MGAQVESCLLRVESRSARPARAGRMTTTEATRIRRDGTRDFDIERQGPEKSRRIDLGITLLQRVAIPGVRYTEDEIAAWAGCTNSAIRLICEKALKKVRKRLECRPDLRRELAELLGRRTA
jgi:hypothetical protein